MALIKHFFGKPFRAPDKLEAKELFTHVLMPKKKIAENEPVVATKTGAAATAKVKAPAKTATTKPRAPRASAKAVTHKHKKTTAQAAESAAASFSAPVSEPSHEEIARLAYSCLLYTSRCV